MVEVILNDLPADHALRNVPLRELGAECCNTNTRDKMWREVKTWGIGRSTFNQLEAGGVWPLSNRFRCNQLQTPDQTP